MRVAACQYPVAGVASAAAYRAKVTRLCEEAAAAGAQVLLLPEYAAVELVALRPEGALATQLSALQEVRALYVDTHAELAARLGVVILAGSFPERLPDSTLRNRAYVFGPNGAVGVQEKLHMTRWEDEAWGIAPGTEVRVFDAFGRRFGVNVCLDVELPAQARRQAESGAEVIFVPSCTDTLHGWHRVRTGALARALENQCFVVMASTVGAVDGVEALDSNVGAAGIFAPMEEGFPADGVLARGVLDASGWIHAELDFERLAAVRASGTVQTFRRGSDVRDVLAREVEAVEVA